MKKTKMKKLKHFNDPININKDSIKLEIAQILPPAKMPRYLIDRLKLKIVK